MNETVSPPGEEGQGPLTVSHVLGEMTWLLTQSPLHRALSIGDIDWLLMPALIHRQFYIFRDGPQPVGLALWAKCDASGEAKLDRGMIEPENRLALEEWNSGSALWLVDLIAPFANAENKQRELMNRSHLRPARRAELQVSPDRPGDGRADRSGGRRRSRRQSAPRDRGCAQEGRLRPC